MKANEILVLSAVASRGTREMPAFKQLALWTGLSVSQCFDAVEGLFEARLLDATRKEIDVDALQDLFFHALPFVLPGRLLTTGHGVSLSLSDTTATRVISAPSSSNLVWPFAGGNAEGLLIEPMHENLQEILRESPSAQDFFSCVEILRFRRHPAEAKARERLRQALELLRDGGSRSAGAAKDQENQTEQWLGIASRVIAETGYRHVDMASLAREIGCSQEELRSRFPGRLPLSGEIARACMARAHAHLGKVMMARPEERAKEARESLGGFLRFLDLNEDYFRLGLWYYVERMFAANDDRGALHDQFFEKLEEIFSSIPSPLPARARAVLFANSWVTYAWFRWVEFPRMHDRKQAESRLEALREALVGLLG